MLCFRLPLVIPVLNSKSKWGWPGPVLRSEHIPSITRSGTTELEVSIAVTKPGALQSTGAQLVDEPEAMLVPPGVVTCPRGRCFTHCCLSWGLEWGFHLLSSSAATPARSRKFQPRKPRPRPEMAVVGRYCITGMSQPGASPSPVSLAMFFAAPNACSVKLPPWCSTAEAALHEQMKYS